MSGTGTRQTVRCAVCGGNRSRQIYVLWEQTIVRCRACGLVYVNPRERHDAIQHRYSAEYFWNEYLPAIGAAGGQYDLSWFDWRYAPLLDLLEREAPGRRLVEIGPGAGFFLKAAERRGWKAAGVELSPEAAAFAREQLGLDVRSGRAEEAGLERCSFDAAVMMDLIEHVFEPRALLETVRGALARGGTVAILTPNFNALSRRVLGADWTILSPLEHMYYFTERTLRRLLLGTGFERVRFEREYAGWGKFEAMNFRNTRRPGSWRARGYEWLVRHDQGQIAARVKRYGFADALLAFAGAGGRPDDA